MNSCANLTRHGSTSARSIGASLFATTATTPGVRSHPREIPQLCIATPLEKQGAQFPRRFQGCSHPCLRRGGRDRSLSLYVTILFHLLVFESYSPAWHQQTTLSPGTDFSLINYSPCQRKESTLERGGFGPTWTYQHPVTAKITLTPILVMPLHPRSLGPEVSLHPNAPPRGWRPCEVLQGR